MLALVLHQVIVFYRQTIVLDQISNWPDIRPFPENEFNIRPEVKTNIVPDTGYPVNSNRNTEDSQRAGADIRHPGAGVCLRIR